MADDPITLARALEQLTRARADALLSAPTAPSHPRQPTTGGLPIARLAKPFGMSAARHVITPIDGHGRLADRSVLRAMQWAPGTPLRMRPGPEIVVVAVDHSAPMANVNRQGHLWLPAAIRRANRLDAGDRLLVVALPDAGLLAIFPVVQLDRMVLGWLQARTGTVTS